MMYFFRPWLKKCDFKDGNHLRGWVFESQSRNCNCNFICKCLMANFNEKRHVSLPGGSLLLSIPSLHLLIFKRFHESDQK